MEAWGIVAEDFVDGSFNGHDWGLELKMHMMAAFNAEDPKVAEQQIDVMLKDLGDPFTRHISAA